MKKIKLILAAIIRATILIAPGVAFALWQWSKVPAFIDLLAAVGLEVIFLFVFAFFKVAIDVARKRTDTPAESPDTGEN